MCDGFAKISGGGVCPENVEALASEVMVLRPEIGAVIRAGYDPVRPEVWERGHAFRLAARGR